MINIERALKQDRLLRALTRLNPKAFQSWLLAFTQVYEQTLTGKPRIGGLRRTFKILSAIDKYCHLIHPMPGFNIPFTNSL